MPVAIISGESGTVWQNNTGKILFQLHVDFVRSCALCIQFAGRIGPYWPVPYHDHCHCRNIPIKPGQQAMPFIDYQEELRQLGPVAQRNAMGASNWRLVESGLAKWEDVVTKGRVRDFREVADRLDLGVDRMVKAGVRPDLARKAYDATHTEAHAAAAKDRAALIKGLKAHGVKDGRIAAEVGDLLASRVGVVGPGGSVSGISPPPQPPPPKSPVASPKPKLAVPKVAALSPTASVQSPKAPKWKPSPAAGFPEFKDATPSGPGGTPSRSPAREEWGRRNSGDWARSITPRERRELIDYSGSKFEFMNMVLRTPKGARRRLTPAKVAELERDNAILAAALERGRTAEPVLAFRGIKNFRTLGVGERPDLRPGDTIADAGFASLSLDRAIASEFAERGGANRVLLEIRMPAGSSGGYLNAGEDPAAPLALSPREHEFLCPPGAEFRVVEDLGSKIVVERVR